MAVEIFTEIPELTYNSGDVLPVEVLTFAGSGREQRAALESKARRRYVWLMRRTKAERLVIDEFFRTANFEVTAFYVKDPDYFARTSVSLGTSILAQTVFDLPATGENSRDYPVDDANFIVYDDGSPVAVASIQTDARTVTTSASPTAGSVMTGDYHAYRLVKLAAPFRWNKLAPDWYECSPELMEVPA